MNSLFLRTKGKDRYSLSFSHSTARNSSCSVFQQEPRPPLFVKRMRVVVFFKLLWYLFTNFYFIPFINGENQRLVWIYKWLKGNIWHRNEKLIGLMLLVCINLKIMLQRRWLFSFQQNYEPSTISKVLHFEDTNTKSETRIDKPITYWKCFLNLKSVFVKWMYSRFFPDSWWAISCIQRTLPLSDICIPSNPGM